MYLPKKCALVLLTDSPNEPFGRLDESSGKIGLRINEEKTKYLVPKQRKFKPHLEYRSL